ncbi:MAG TPA: flippase [Methanocella sp.]|nr:flippase [Methanocella sp.]
MGGKDDIVTTIAKGTVFLIAMQVLIFICGFASKIVLTHWLSPDEVGVVSLTASWVGIFSVVFIMGVPGSITRFIPEYLAKGRATEGLLSTSLKIVLVGAAAGAISSFLMADFLAINIFHQPTAIEPFRIASLIIFFTMLYRLFSYSVMGFQRMGRYVVLESANTISTFFLTFAMLYMGYGLIGAVVSSLISIIVTTTVSAYMLWRMSKFKLITGYNRDEATTLMLFGIPFYSAVVIEMVLGWTDSFLLGALRGTAQVGYYSIGLWMMGIIATITWPINTAIYPAFSELHAKAEHSRLEQIFNRSVKYNVVLLLPIATGSIMLADMIVPIFGTDFLPSISAVQILAIAAVFSSLRTTCTKFISATGRPREVMKFVLIATVTNIVLNYFLILRYDFAGAAVATTISFGIFMLLCFNFIRKSMRLSIDYLPHSIAALLVMIAVIIGLRYVYSLVSLPGSHYLSYLVLLVIIVISGAVYFAALYLSGGLDETDMGMIKRYAGRYVKPR